MERLVKGNVKFIFKVSKKLSKKMDKYPWVDWGNVVITAFKEKLEKYKKLI